MDSFVYSLNSTIPIFLVMIVGGVIKKLGVIDEHFTNAANKYVFVAALPVLLFKDLSRNDFKSQFDMSFVLFCFITTIVMFGGVWVMTDLLMKEDSMKGSFIQCSCRSSAAILGMAFIQNMYSDTGMAPLMIVAAVPLFNVISVVVLTFKADGCKSEGVAYKNVSDTDKSANIKKAFINIAKNPIIIGILLGLVSSLLGITYPEIVNKTIDSIAQTATPIALICIGAGFEGRKAIKKIKPTVIAAFVKLIGIAMAALPAAVWLGFRNQELMSILIMVASPTTVTSYIMAKNMNNDEVLASSIVVLTTLLSSITLTGWIFVLRFMGLV
ncbi:MAG: AEC family transporter [Eubacteriales bacterium]|nr:AEC family transporter [Eubacteriales bacterium]